MGLDNTQVTDINLGNFESRSTTFPRALLLSGGEKFPHHAGMYDKYVHMLTLHDGSEADVNFSAIANFNTQLPQDPAVNH